MESAIPLDLPAHLKRVTYPACLVIFLEFIHLDSVFASGPIIEQKYAVFVIELIRVTDGKAVAGHAVSAHSPNFRSCVLIPP
jgi:hypothetical protein